MARPRLLARSASVSTATGRPDCPPMAREGLAASTGRPVGSAAPLRTPAPARREGGDARRRPPPPCCLVGSHASSKFRAPGGQNSPPRTCCGATYNRPILDRVQPRLHPVRAITRISALCPPRVPCIPPASDAPRGPETPRKGPERAGIGGKGGCTHATAPKSPGRFPHIPRSDARNVSEINSLVPPRDHRTISAPPCTLRAVRVCYGPVQSSSGRGCLMGRYANLSPPAYGDAGVPRAAMARGCRAAGRHRGPGLRVAAGVAGLGAEGRRGQAAGATCGRRRRSAPRVVLDALGAAAPAGASGAGQFQPRAAPRLAGGPRGGRARRRGAPRGPANSSRARLADWLRRRGLTWRQVARACGYSEADNGHSARKAVRRYRQHLAERINQPQAPPAPGERHHAPEGARGVPAAAAWRTVGTDRAPGRLCVRPLGAGDGAALRRARGGAMAGSDERHA